ncbi:transposase [Arcicella aquatica]
MKFWQKRGLYIFYLSQYSPHLNIIERLWQELKAKRIKPEDYL